MPEATVAAVVFTPDGERLVLVQRTTEPFSGLWCLPGGHIDENETAEEAIRREVKEEAGITFVPRMWRTFDELLPEFKIHAVVSVFQGVSDDALKPLATDVGDARWFSFDEAARMPLAFKHNQIVAAFQAGWRANSVSGGREEALAEFKALREEALERMRLRNMAQISVLTVAAALVAGGMKNYIPPGALMVYPAIACFLALLWGKNDVRIGEIGEYIRDTIESHHPGLGWEHHLRRINLLAYCRNGRADRSTEWAAYGLFAISQVLVALLAGYQFYANHSGSPLVWLGLGPGAVWVLAWALVAWNFIRRRRRSYQSFRDKAAPVNSCTDPNLLAEIAKDTTIRAELRLAAVANQHLVNREFFEGLARDEKEDTIREAANKRLKGQVG